MAPVTDIKQARFDRRLRAEGWRMDDAICISVAADDDAMVVFDVTTAPDQSGFLVALDVEDALRVLHELEAAISRATRPEGSR